MLRSEEITAANADEIDWDEGNFKYCSFSSVDLEKVSMVSSDFFSCTFTDIQWYWTLFNESNFIDCKFSRCIFAGVAFPETRFVDCKFTDCEFIKDNMGGDCDLSCAVAYGCVAERCTGLSLLVENAAKDASFSSPKPVN